MEKKYEVKKIVCGVRNGDNSRVYENEKQFDRFKDLKEFLSGTANIYFYGQGSDIFMNGEKIAHSSDFAMVENQAKEGLMSITLKTLLKEVAYNK